MLNCKRFCTFCRRWSTSRVVIHQCRKMISKSRSKCLTSNRMRTKRRIYLQSSNRSRTSLQLRLPTFQTRRVRTSTCRKHSGLTVQRVKKPSSSTNVMSGLASKWATCKAISLFTTLMRKRWSNDNKLLLIWRGRMELRSSRISQWTRIRCHYISWRFMSRTRLRCSALLKF